MTTTDFEGTDRAMAERACSYAGHIEDMDDEERVLLLGYLAQAVLRLLGRQATLGETQPGDLFYLDSNPSAVYWRNDHWRDDYSFMMLGDEIWRPMEHVGTGMSDQAVTVVHNTKKEPT